MNRHWWLSHLTMSGVSRKLEVMAVWRSAIVRNVFTSLPRMASSRSRKESSHAYNLRTCNGNGNTLTYREPTQANVHIWHLVHTQTMNIHMMTEIWGHRGYIYENDLYYDDVIMTTIASQITSLTNVYSTVYSDADQRKHQSSASLAFVWGSGKCFHLMTSSCLGRYEQKSWRNWSFEVFNRGLRNANRHACPR